MNKIYLILMFNFFLFGCNNQLQPKDKIPVHESFTIESKLLNEKRVINVWTPKNYIKNKDSLTVVYMLDGGIKEDFPHIANTLAELIEAKKIQPLLLVGIENTERRRDLTGPTEVEKDKEIAPVVGESEKFRAFINNELFIEINKKYRTTSKKGIIGESLAGLFVVETLMLKPEMFNFYIAFDPSLWWNDHHLEKNATEYLTNFPADKKRFWFAGSGAIDISTSTNNLSKIIEISNKPSLNWKYADEPNEEHNTIFRATKEKALIWVLNY